MLKGIAASSAISSTRAIWDVSKLRLWMSAHPPSVSSFFEVSRHLALLLLLASGRRVHDLTLLKVNDSSLQIAHDSVTFWPMFGSKTDSSSFQQSGWHFTNSPSEIIWDVPYWVRIFLSLRSTRIGNSQIDTLFISTFGKVRSATRSIIAGWVKKALTAAGIPFSAGSMRSAVNSALARENFSLDVILKRGNWRSADTFLRHYYKPLSPRNTVTQNTAMISSFHPVP